MPCPCSRRDPRAARCRAEWRSGASCPPKGAIRPVRLCLRASECLALERFAQVDRMSQRGAELIAMQLAFPATDDDGGKAIADQIGQRTALTHELVDPKQNRQCL